MKRDKGRRAFISLYIFFFRERKRVYITLMKKKEGLVRLCFVKKGFDWLINEGWRKKSHRPRIKRRGYTWWKWFFFFFCSLSYAMLLLVHTQRQEIQQKDTIKKKPSQPIWRPGSFSVFSSMRWPNIIVDSILCGTISPAHTFFSYYYYTDPLLFTPKI